VSVGDGTILNIALFMRAITVIVHVLGAETPATCLPEGALLLNVVGVQLVALEAIGEFGFASLMPLA